MSHKVICIGRQFGSGGFLIGKALSEKLGIPFYDKNIIALASERSGLSSETLEKGDERKTSQWFYMGMTDVTGATLASPPPSDVTYALQRDIILDAAKEHDCIIVGRCSDAILHQTDAKVLSVFISAPFEDRVKRRMHEEALDEKTTIALVKKNDKRRKAYYNFNTGLEWGAPENYDLCLNSSSLGIDGAVELLAKLYEKL